MATSIMEQGAARMAAWLQRRARHAPDNFYLEGPYAPVEAERTETDLRVSGTIPEALDGLFAQIGPNPLQVPNPATHHWFVGDGMVHGVRLQAGKACWYRNRWVGTDTVNDHLGRARVPGPRRGIFDVVNTNVFAHGDGIWATVEAGPLPAELDAELNTLRRGLFHSDARLPFTAHPHRDPQTGELHAVCYDALQRNRLIYQCIDAEGVLRRRVNIPVRHGPMVHDCAITTRYVVVFDLPVTFSFRALLAGAALPYRWNPRHRARVGLLPRDGSSDRLQWFPVAPCYVFHACNAFDNDDGSVTVDVVTHARMFDRSQQGPEAQQVAFERWRVGADLATVQRQVLSSESQEFPRCDERRTGQNYRYAYAVGGQAMSTEGSRLLRHDLQRGTTTAHDFGPGQMMGEAIFVPAHPDAAEDEGWLLAYVHDAKQQRSRLVILDAQAVDRQAQAVVHLPVRVPLGFHSNWMPLTA
ncbi:MAG: carotenoid oxygenase family protein [Algiphilus sp.]